MMDEANLQTYADVFTRFEREGVRYVVTSGSLSSCMAMCDPSPTWMW
jgi:hypothetical protein